MSEAPTEYWSGKAAVVTGAAHGIGRAVAIRLHSLGSSVALVDVDRPGLEAALTALADEPERALIASCDVSDRDEVEDLARLADDRFGGTNFLVNCAYTGGQVPFLEMTDDFWHMVMRVNLGGTLLMGQAVARLMVARGIKGRIVNFISGAARVARPGHAAYGCSKAGIAHLTRYMAIELAEHGILVNAVNPGLTASEWVSGYELDRTNAAEHAYKMTRIPLGRMGECDEAARLVTFLLGPEAGFLTGGMVVSDGGTSALLRGD